RIELPPGATAEGLCIRFGHFRPGVFARVNADGSFVSPPLAPGHVELSVDGRWGELVQGELLQLELQPGEQEEVTLNARALGMAWLNVAVSVYGRPAPDAWVQITMGEGADFGGASLFFHARPVDAKGCLSMPVQAVGQVRLDVRGYGKPFGSWLGGQTLELEPGKRLDVALDLSPPVLAIVLPRDLPQRARLRVEIAPSKRGSRPRVVHIPIEQGTLQTGGIPWLRDDPENGRVLLDAVGGGDWVVTAVIEPIFVGAVPPADAVGGGERPGEWVLTAVHRLRAEVQLVPGQTREVSFAERR
ncbi:MAG: hypothetical protein R3E96_17560, partial [Planctomycetota bacterium]